MDGAARGRPALRALALRRELRHGPDRGLRRWHAGDRLRHRRLQRRRHRRRRRRARPARRPAAPRRGAAARPPRARAPGGDGRGGARRAPQRYAWPRVADRVSEVYERAIEAPAPRDRGRAARPLGRDCARPTAPPPSPPRRLPSLDPPLARTRQPPAARRPPRRPGVAGVARRRPDRAGGAEDRRRQRGREHRPLRPHLGPGRLRADGALDLLARRLLVRDRARGAARTGRCGAAT